MYYNGEDIKRNREEFINNLFKSFNSDFESTEEDIEKAKKVDRNDGDIHPNGKWFWNSSVNGGKGDWRVIKQNTSNSKTSSSESTKKVKEVSKKLEKPDFDHEDRFANDLWDALEKRKFEITDINYFGGVNDSSVWIAVKDDRKTQFVVSTYDDNLESYSLTYEIKEDIEVWSDEEDDYVTEGYKTCKVDYYSKDLNKVLDFYKKTKKSSIKDLKKMSDKDDEIYLDIDYHD